MKKLSLLALLLALSACKSDKLEGEAIKATVTLDPGVKASCIHVEVRDPATHVRAAEDWVPRGNKNELQVAIFRKSLPKDVEIAAQPYQDGDCEGETVARTVNGAFVTVTASFVEGQVVPAQLPKMMPGTDTDNDGYVSTDTGGADCQDGAGGGGINPGVQEQCSDQQDLNCDSKPGCAASTCGANACFGQPASLVLALSTPVTAGTCTQGTVRVKDSNGNDSRAVTNTAVSLGSNPNGGIAFYSSADCSTPLPSSSVTIAQGEGGATFFFQGQTVGLVTVSASASGLPTATQAVQINPGAGNQLFFLSQAQQVTAGTCSGAVQIQSRDAQGNASPVTSATPITLTATPSTNFQFFSSSSCTTGTELASVTMAANSSTATFYFKGTKAGAVSVAATASGFTGNTQTETIKPAAAKTVILTGPATATAGDCTLTKVDVTLQDTYSNPTTAAANTTINLSATGKPLTFSANSGCGTSTSSVVIGTGQPTVSFFFRGTLAGASTITGAATGLTSGTLNVTMNAAAPSSHVFTTTAQTVQAGNCSGVVTVQMQDGFTNPALVTSDTTVLLSAAPPDGFQFFAGAGCSGSAVTQVTVLTGTSDVNFSFKPTRTASVVVTAAVGATNKTQTETVGPSAPSALVLSPASVPMLAGECKQVTVQAQDSFGNPSPVSGNQTVTLAGNPSAGFGFYSNSGCTNSIGTSVTISGGQSNASFYVKGTTTGTVTVTASHAPWTDGTATVTVSPAAPSKIVFKTGAQNVVVGACSNVTTLEVQDAFNNPVSIGTSRTINLSASAGGLTFYTSAGCSASSTTSVAVPAGQTTVDFYFKATSSGSTTITASDGTLTNGTQTETIDPLPPDALAFTTPERSAVAATCSGVLTVETRAQGNPTPVTTATAVTPSATGLTFYTTNTCATAATSFTINSGQSNVSFYFKGTTAGTVLLTATAGSLSTTQNATVTPATPNKLAFTTPVYSTPAGTCSFVLTVQSVDQYGNPVAVTQDNVLTPNQSGTPVDNQFKFYSDPTCTTQISNFPLLTGALTASFYYRGEIARSVGIAVGASNLPNGSPIQTHSIVPGALSKLAFSSTTPPQTLLAGTCAMRTIERQDFYGNIRADAVDLAVTLSGSTAADFFQDSNCTTPLPSFNILSGSGAATFYFKGYTGGTSNNSAPLTLTAASSGLTSATQIETINPTVRTGSCTLTGTTITCNMALAVSAISKAFMVFRATTTDTGADDTSVRCRLSSTTQLVCDRGHNGADAIINWTVAEFPTGVTAQHVTPTCTGDTTTAAVSTVVPGESFVLLSSERNVNDQGSSVPRLVELKSATQAEIRKTTGACTGGDVTNLQVVDFPGASVQRGVATGMTSGQTSTTATLGTAVTTSRSVLLYSYRIDNTGTKICDRAVRGELTNGTTLTFSRGEGDTANCAGMTIPEISWEVVQFPPGTTVQQFTQQFSGSATPITVSAVDLSRTMVFAGGQWAAGQIHGEGRYSGGENINEMRAQATFIDNTTLQLSRATSNASATFTVFVVQFKP